MNEFTRVLSSLFIVEKES